MIHACSLFLSRALLCYAWLHLTLFFSYLHDFRQEICPNSHPCSSIGEEFPPDLWSLSLWSLALVFHRLNMICPEKNLFFFLFCLSSRRKYVFCWSLSFLDCTCCLLLVLENVWPWFKVFLTLFFFSRIPIMHVLDLLYYPTILGCSFWWFFILLFSLLFLLKSLYWSNFKLNDPPSIMLSSWCVYLSHSSFVHVFDFYHLKKFF